MPLNVARVDWLDPRAVAQRAAMDSETSAMYAEFIASVRPEDQAAIDDALSVNPADIVVTILALDGDEVVGHSALRPFPYPAVEPVATLEVKKVFVPVEHRGRGISRVLMLELEAIARERGVASLVLQTGPLQRPAIALYESLGYQAIPPYGKYTVIPNALCYQKSL